MRRKRGRGAKIYEGGGYLQWRFFYHLAVNMLVVWKYTKSSTLAKLKLKPKKRNFPRSEIAKGQEEDGSQKVHG